MNDMHGRSSDSFLFAPPSRPSRQWLEYGTKLQQNLQQRDCSGFSPDSLLIPFPKLEKTGTVAGAKVRIIFEIGAMIKKNEKKRFFALYLKNLLYFCARYLHKIDE